MAADGDRCPAPRRRRARAGRTRRARHAPRWCATRPPPCRCRASPATSARCSSCWPRRPARLGLEPDLHAHDLAALRRASRAPGRGGAARGAVGAEPPSCRRRRRGASASTAMSTSSTPAPGRGGSGRGRARSRTALHGRGSVDMKAAWWRRCTPPRACGPRASRDARRSSSVRGLGGGRRARDVRRARARRGVRRGADPRADGVRRGLRAGGRAHLPRHMPGAARTRRSGSRGARRSTATWPVHAALAEHERRVNADVAHPLMRELGAALPAARRARGGGHVVELRCPTGWSSRAASASGSASDPADARAAFEAAVATR